VKRTSSIGKKRRKTSLLLPFYKLIVLLREEILRYDPDLHDWVDTGLRLEDPDFVFLAVKVPSDYLECEF